MENGSDVVVCSDWSTPSMSVKTFIVDRIIHSTAVRTTPAMPSATESRKLIFMTDHGSTRATARRTRRGPLVLRAAPVGRTAAVAAVAGPVPGAPGVPDAAASPTRCCGLVRVVTAPRDSDVSLAPPDRAAPEAPLAPDEPLEPLNAVVEPDE